VEATGKIVEIGGPETLTMDEVLLIIRKVIGLRRPFIHHPVWCIKPAAAPPAFLP